jgi:dienelactone hydrolase
MARVLMAGACALLASCAAQPVLQDFAAGPTGPVAYPSLMEKVVLTGVLRLPESAARAPVVIIAHGTGGVDGRGARWASFFLAHGIGSLEIDYFGPRGVSGGVTSRLPTPTHDIYSAAKMLATHPRVDASRIAVIGFSRGGAMALDSANYTETLAGVRTAAHIGVYPWCGADLNLLDEPRLPPALVLSGAKDHYLFASTCERAVQRAGAKGRHVRYKAYEDAYHGWDGTYSGEVRYSYVDLAYRIQADAAVTRRSMEDALAFLRAAMKLP